MPEILFTNLKKTFQKYSNQKTALLSNKYSNSNQNLSNIRMALELDAYGQQQQQPQQSKKFPMMTAAAAATAMDITKIEINHHQQQQQQQQHLSENDDDHHRVHLLQHQQSSASQQLCAGCEKSMQDRYLLKALDVLWHEDCLKCGCCDCRLGEVGSTLYTKGNLILCRRDYLRLFGNTGDCAACTKKIPAFEMVMRAKNNVYHLDCFACQQCNHRFCIGDRFYLCENKILCEYDYEERLVFASMTNHHHHSTIMKRHTTTNSIATIQQQHSPRIADTTNPSISNNLQQRAIGGGAAGHRNSNLIDFNQRNLQTPAPSSASNNKTNLYNEIV